MSSISSISFKYFRLLFISIIAVVLIIAITITHIDMQPNSDIGTKELIVKGLDKLSLYILGVTLLAGVVSYYLKGQLEEEAKKQLKELKTTIAQRTIDE